MARKKKKALDPRRKRMTKSARLNNARSTEWVKNYPGKKVIKGYCTWYGVDWRCAVLELRSLGVSISEARVRQLEASAESRSIERARRAQQRNPDLDSESDDEFVYIAGYTAGGAPYGVTHEEFRCEEQGLAGANSSASPLDHDDGDLPF